jgi:hypothetical protein
MSWERGKIRRMNDIEAAAIVWTHWWCYWFHGKHHRWTGNWRRQCDKCECVRIWPDKQRIAQLEAQPRLVRMDQTSMTFSSLPSDLQQGELLGLSNILIKDNIFIDYTSDRDFPEDSPILE